MYCKNKHVNTDVYDQIKNKMKMIIWAPKYH